MTAAPGPQQPDEVRHEQVGGNCMDCGGIKWPCPTEVRRIERRPAAPSAQPDEGASWSCPNPNCPRVYEREPGIDDRQWGLKRDLVAKNHLWHCLYATPAQPVRDTEEGRR